MAKRESYESRVEAYLLPLMERHGFELVDVEYVKEAGTWYLRAYIDKEGGIGVVTASWNDRVVSLGLSRWTPLRGWVPGLSWPVERTGGAVDGATAYYSWTGGPEEPERFPYVVYGVVNDPSVTEVRLTCRVMSFDAVFQEDIELPVEIRQGGDGHQYFLETLVAEGICSFTYTAFGREGTVSGDIPLATSLIYDWDDM